MSTGSVYERKDGQWVAAVVVSGRKVVRYGKTEREARQRLRELLTAHHMGTLAAPSKLRLSDWVAQWMKMQEGERRASTLRTYRQTLTPVVERLGGVRLDKLTPAALALTFTDLRKQGNGTRKVQQGYAALHTCLGAAVKLNIIAANPLARVDKPRHEPAERVCWNDEQARKFIGVAEASSLRYAPLLLVLLGGGLRVSEGRALTWADVDFGAGTISITKALVMAGERPTLERTKSKAGTRTIALPRFALDALVRLPRPMDPATRIFQTEGGLPPGENIVRATLTTLCKEAGVPRITVHDLRHASASLILAEGVDLATVSKRLGHSKVSTTANIYVHAVKPDRAAVEAFERAIGQ